MAYRYLGEASEVLSNECTFAQGPAAVRRLGAKCRGLTHRSTWKGVIRNTSQNKPHSVCP
jgi:hypothetical protein